MFSLIFSKNRACQLELCLRSHQRFWGEQIKVLYVADKEFQSGYDKLKKMYPDVEFITQTDFWKQVNDLVEGKFTTFNCDDDVMIREFHEGMPEFLEFRNNPDILTLSFRLGQHYDYSWDAEVSFPTPEFRQGMWEWWRYGFDYGYPMSVLGNIFRTSDIKPLLDSRGFTSPNTLESVLAKDPISRPLMICFDEPRSINLPMNLVQNEAKKNRYAGLSTKELNQKFLNGYVIDLDDIIEKAKESKSCFMSTEIKWQK